MAGEQLGSAGEEEDNANDSRVARVWYRPEGNFDSRLGVGCRGGAVDRRAAPVASGCRELVETPDFGVPEVPGSGAGKEHGAHCFPNPVRRGYSAFRAEGYNTVSIMPSTEPRALKSSIVLCLVS